jgi:predicted ArsR family transcriptional regulator
MRASLVLGAGRGPRLAVLETVKRFPGGIGVTELSGELGMSYMGVKAHCLALEKTGYLEGRRGVSSKGRPKHNYRLTESGEDLFRGVGNDLTLALLREAVGLFGTSAPQKLLMMYFRSEGIRYASLIHGKVPADRVASFVRIRDAEGRISSLVDGSPAEIHECHDPLGDLRKAYPAIRAMEEAMVGEALGMTVRLEEREGRKLFLIGA